MDMTRESTAICKYLCTKYAEKATKLTINRADTRAFAVYEQLLGVEVTTFDTAKDLVSETLFKKWVGPHFYHLFAMLLLIYVELVEKLLMKQKLHAFEQTSERSWMSMSPACLRPQNILLET
jgi:intracellular septation protein A